MSPETDLSSTTRFTIRRASMADPQSPSLFP